MNSGCICCSLVGDFSKALDKVLEEYKPDRVLIEPSGVGKLSDVIRAVKNTDIHGAVLNSYTTVIDANKCKMYMKNFGEFFNDQVESAGCIVLSHTDVSDKKLSECVGLIKEHNSDAVIVTTPWDELSGDKILEAIERSNTLVADIEKMEEEHHCHEHEHEHEHEHHHHHDDECDCGCDHDHGHEHHHHHDDECDCGCGHDHEHHHHHHADEVFSSFGRETVNKYSKEEIENILNELIDSGKYGMILRAKGIVSGQDSEWIHFDYVPGEPDVRTGSAGITGRICVIGSKINEEEISKLFRL